jgi:DNA-binding XRE family transcriptional regulator
VAEAGRPRDRLLEGIPPQWEKGRAEPELRFLPAIFAFLGYDPRPAPATFGGRIRAAREAEGLCERELSRRLGLDPGTVAAWERDEIRRPYPRIRRVFERWLVSVGRAGYETVNSAAGTCQERR